MVPVVERLHAGAWVPPWIYHQHITRYQWAGPLVQGKTVLDAACGTGYGSNMLLEAGAQSVDGFDVSAEAIAEAQNNHARDRLRFALGDVTRLPVSDAHYDAYVSFETIEHIQDDTAYLKEARRVLKPSGALICSTPNRLLTNPGISISDRPFNPYHIREYTHAELKALLERFFSSVVFYGQSAYGLAYIRFLSATGRRFPKLAVRLHQTRKTLGIPLCRSAHHFPQAWNDNQQPEVMIALCTQPK
jgi:ubiquinone/menaquinone biosynthesis C-methylase UbiE